MLASILITKPILTAPYKQNMISKVKRKFFILAHRIYSLTLRMVKIVHVYFLWKVKYEIEETITHLAMIAYILIPETQVSPWRCQLRMDFKDLFSFSFIDFLTWFQQ